MTKVTIALMVVLTAVACSPPDFVTERPELDQCTDEDVYLPIGQASAAAAPASQAALDCFQNAVDNGLAIELSFTLIGAEGQHYDAYLQHRDGMTNYYREHDKRVWTAQIDCSTLVWPEPVVPDVSDCEREHIPKD